MPFDGEVLEGEIVEGDGPAITVTIVYNALDTSNHDVAELVWVPGKTLAHYMQGLPEGQSWTIVGRHGPIQHERWDDFIPEMDDRFVVILTPEGPLAALIPLILSVAASAAGPALGTALFGSAMIFGVSAASVFGAVFAAAVGVLGMFIANALGARVQPTGQGQGPDSSPSYSINGAKNTSAEGTAIPVVYGEFWEGGNLVNFYTENTPNGLSQVAYLQYVVSEGEIESIEDIRINGQPWGYYTNITWDYRTGTLDQTPLGWFASTVSSYQSGATINNTTPITYTTHSEVDQFSLNVNFPNGLYHINSRTGDSGNQTVPFTILFREQGATDWTQLATEFTWIAIDPNDATTPTCIGIRVTVQAQGNASGPTTPYDFTVTWTNETGPPSTNTQQYAGWMFQGFGTPSQGGSKGDTGTLGSASGIISNNYTVDPSGATSYTPGTVTKTFEITGLNGAGYALGCTGGTIVAVEVLGYNNLSVTANERSQLNYTIRSPKLTRGIYEIQISRTTAQANDMYTADQAILTEVSEIQADAVAYIGTAYYAVRIGLDAINSTNANLLSTLNGLPTIVAKVKGRKVGIYDKNGVLLTTAWSNNPADIALDILLNWRNRYGVVPTHIDFPSFDRMRQNCATNGLTFNGVFDFETTMWDALMYVMRAGHANLIMSGVRWTAILDAPSDPTMMFTADNIIKDSFQTYWIGTDTRFNSIEVQYYDKNDYNRRHSQFAIDYNALAAGFPIRSTTINGVGFDDPQQAANEAQLQLNKNLYLLQGCQFDAPIEAIGCAVGDVVYVQHDMPQWGYAAIIQTVTSTHGHTTVTIDSEIPFDGNSDWHILFIQGASQIATLTVEIVQGNQVRFSGQGATTGAHRMLINSIDYEVIDEVIVGTELVITADRNIDTSGGVGPGTQVQLYQTDVITEAALAPITVEAGSLQGDASSTDGFNLLSEDGSTILNEEASSIGVRSLQLAGWIGTQGNPKPNDRVMIGRVGKFKKPFWVTKIGYRDKNLRSMQLVEYNATIYDGAAAVQTPNYSALTTLPSQVLNLRAYQTAVQHQGGAMSYTATCVWDSPLNDTHVYTGAKVWVSVNFSDFNMVGDVLRGGNSFTVSANVGDLIRFKVVAYDQAKQSADYNAAPIAAIEVGATARVPPVPTNVVVTPGIKQVAVRWDSVADDYIKGYEIWESDTDESFSDAALVWSGQTNHYLRSGLTMGDTIYLWVRTVAITGVYSGYAGPFAASPTYALTADIGDAILTTAKFAQSIKPVTLITDLTGSGVTNQVYFNEADNKLYKWVITNGTGAWQPVVNAGDLSGQITRTQITDGAVSTPQLAANSVTSDILTSDSVIAGKVAAGAIGATEIAANSIESQHLASAEIITEAIQIGNGVIETVHIGDAQITTAKIGSLQVGTGNIANNAITNLAVVSGGVDGDAGPASIGLSIYTDGSPILAWWGAAMSKGNSLYLCLDGNTSNNIIFGAGGAGSYYIGGLSAGTHSLYMLAPAGSGASNVTLTVMVVKR